MRWRVPALTAAAAIVATVLIAQPSQAAATTLGAAAAAQGRVFGAAVANGHLSEAQYAATLDAEFTGLTPENEMKWDSTEPSRGTFSFTSSDALVAHAQAHGLKVRGHTLVWHQQYPSWVGNITDGTDLLAAMRAHIAGVAGHFQGKIQYWDVVNEAFDGANRRQSIFQQRIGDSYIEEAFKAARAADQAAKLCYNDYGTDGVNAKSTAVLDMVKDFKARGVPIDCVGFQAHLIVGQVPGDLQANLQRFADAGVDVNITELDVRMTTPASAADLTTQASDYRKIVAACLAVSRCTSITTWGITDKYSWVPNTFPGQGAPLLFDDNYGKKAAYQSTLEALGGSTSSPSPSQPSNSASCAVSYTVNNWNTGLTASVTIKNNGTTAINGWALAFTLPSGQTVTNAWNATVSPASGTTTARNVGYNSTIAAGGSTSFGFQATHTGDAGRPNAFTLNGASCSLS